MNHPHPRPSELLAHRRRELPAADALELGDHLAGCAVCREDFKRLETGKTPGNRRVFVPAVGAPGGADYETLAAYLDGTLDDTEREILEGDMRNHPSIAAQVEDLRRFREKSDTALETPAPPARKVVAFPSQRMFWAAAAAVVLLTVVAGTWRWRVDDHAGGHREGLARQTTVGTFPNREDQALLAAADGTDIPDDLKADLRRVAAGGPLPIPAELRALAGAGGTLLDEPAARPGTGASFTPLWPVGTVVRQDRPTLRWTSREGAAAYRVVLSVQETGEIVRSPDLHPAPGTPEITWTPTDNLRAGNVYEWQVQALDNNGEVLERQPSPPRSEARFRVLDTRKEIGLAALEKARHKDHLLLAVAYARAGLFPEAKAQLQASVIADSDAALPARLMKDLPGPEDGQHGQPQGAPAPTATKGAQ